MGNKQAALVVAAKVNKEHGPDTVVLASDMAIARRFPTGSVSLDVALGGGWPANQWCEVIGRESHGKTAVCLKTIAANQKADPEFLTLWVAAEHYDLDQAAACGVDNDRVIVIPTQEMEFAYQTILEYAASHSVDAIVLDSYPALIPDEESAKDMDESVMAIGARLTGKFFRKAGAATKRNLRDPDDAPMLGLMINQYRDQIGGFSPIPGAVAQTSPGGNAKNYAFYVRVEVRRDEFIEEARPGKGKVKVGQTIKVKTIKNKAAAPQQVASIDFYFRDAPMLGFSRGDYDVVKEVSVMGVLFGVITKRGAWFSFNNGEVDADGKPRYRWQGMPAMVEFLRGNLDLQEEVTAAVMEAVRTKSADHISDEDVAEAETAGTKKITRRRNSATPKAEAA
jgi:recombination protein RecA